MSNAAAVATPHPQATLAARDILLAGGNAFDAVVAAVLTLGVVQPHQVGLGGFGGSLVGYLKRDDKAVAIDFDSRAPLAFTPEAFADPIHRTMGYRSITVPAVLAGLEIALKSFGTMGWREVAAHAIGCAEQGSVVDPTLGHCLAEWKAKTDADSRAAFFSDGKVPRTGELWVQKDLARLLRRIAEEGPEVFYRGEIGAAIVRQIRSHGGILSERDFAEYRARRVAPITIDYRGHDLYTPPPPSGGLTTLQILKTMERFDLAKFKPWSAEYFHVLARAARMCWEDRDILGDPDVIDIPMKDLLSSQRAIERAERIRRGDGSATNSPSPDGPCTANVSIIDREHNAASLTATQGVYFGSRVVIPGLGLIMNHGMSRFDFPPEGRERLGADDHPNAPRPGKRVQHNMVPTIAIRDAEPHYAVGLPGGTRIIAVTAQLLINLIDFGASAMETVRAPRIDAQIGKPIIVSSAVSDAQMDELRAWGNEVARGQVEGPPLEVGGNANALAFDPATGKMEAASQAWDDAAVVIA